MYLTHLSLTNYRSYARLELALQPGLSVFVGGNAQGKSNLLEACAVLAVARSPRTESDRELVSWDAAARGEPAVVVGTVRRRRGDHRIVVAVQAPVGGPAAEGEGEGSVRKSLRVDGRPAKASQLVGTFNAVLFTPEDVDLALGGPQGRRRYLDLLLSQVDATYLRALQRYARVVVQRNSLLRLAREQPARADELLFWDERLALEGAAVLRTRVEALAQLAPMVAETHADLSGAPGTLRVEYAPSVPGGEDMETFRAAVTKARAKEIAIGATTLGPHRDDLRLLLDGVEVNKYASRGQARTVALSLQLAQADYLERAVGDPPVVLLDDVLSELDERRRGRVMAKAMAREQVLLTAAGEELLDPALLAGARRYTVERGTVRSD